jgi:hypothetical protein
MVVPSMIIAWLYANNYLSFQTLALDATLVIAVTFFGSTIAAAVLPWKQKDMYDGSPIAKIKMPGWLGYLVMLLYVVGAIYLIVNSVTYAATVFAGLPASGADALKWIAVILIAGASVANILVLVWVGYYVGTRIMKGEAMALVTLAGLVFLLFLDWLLIEWLWDPHTFADGAFGFAQYGIGWSNASSIVFMVVNYAVAAAIFYGFNAYRKRQGIDIDKVYKEIPVE